MYHAFDIISISIVVQIHVQAMFLQMTHVGSSFQQILQILVIIEQIYSSSCLPYTYGTTDFEKKKFRRLNETEVHPFNHPFLVMLTSSDTYELPFCHGTFVDICGMYFVVVPSHCLLEE
ncbi:unnamed protein product [Soboliphyme baturini]|uniref:Secreted protein n=1 Tax=Soboliphyme baturini TaxID=241478 RepID=A0A183IPB3_9BILA|nr:unnamed protein product [Soboliphyme baturini]